jgi:dTMP kinase
MSAPRGRFITLEGGDGAGKTTLARNLAADLRAKGRDVVVTREPGGSPGADEIRKLIVEGPPDRWSSLSEALLFSAARNDHLERTIRPALARGAWVICDRYLDSTIAYQVIGRGLPEAVFAALRDLIGAQSPDLTLVLDIDPAIGLKRAAARGGPQGRYEAIAEAFHARVRQGFLDIAAQNPQRCAVLPADQAPESLAHAALAVVEQRLL